MAAISRPHVGHHTGGFEGLLRGALYLAMAIGAIVIAVPAAIATVG
ncbi:MAG TPA: hypothetical protein PKM48_07810 [Parvularculaceae bacterium]|nr:hypothetical protein [Parvularculaceae bacterium]HNS86364.1 hypothetical protein [Parvularculaceae bacterium]